MKWKSVCDLKKGETIVINGTDIFKITKKPAFHFMHVELHGTCQKADGTELQKDIARLDTNLKVPVEAAKRRIQRKP